jgi:2-amino-4-hydroxy-6-hydroxymethyldihydropteridine diphosphokinase
MYVVDQAAFLNGCAKLTTSLNPHQLMKLMQNVEQTLGRESLDQRVRNGPRCIDLDILFFNDWVIKTEDLIIPHPRLQEREFVLRPLTE